MHLRPLSRPLPIALMVVAAGVLLASPLWGPRAVRAVQRIIDDSPYDAAADRHSPPVPRGDALGLPAVLVAPPPAGADPGIELSEIVALEAPSAVVDPPGAGPVLVTTLVGQVHALDLATGDIEVVLDLSEEVSTGGERGLLGAAIDPDGERLYLDYTDSSGDTEIRSWPLDDENRPVGGPGAGVLHLEIGQPFENHNGGHLAFGPDGALWIGTGDGGGGGDQGNLAQDPASLLGKMLRVVPDPEGGVRAPTTNPDWGGRPEVWAIGLRNPWRYSFDRATNRLWIADVGQEEAEEVSVIDPAAADPNFGWNVVEGNVTFRGEARPEFTAPALTYTHDDGCSVTGGYVYRGEDIPGLYGWYLFADYCGGWVRAVPVDDPGAEPVELLSELGPVISFAELEDGELLVLLGGGVSAVTTPR